jgi:hypothetical protein
MSNEIILNNFSLEDDDMIKLIYDNFLETDINLFKSNYQIYLEYRNNNNSFVVDIDNIYKLLGLSTKDYTKTLLSKYFILNKDFIIINDLVLLTINCFKKFCIKVNTEEADNLYNNYIKLEDVISKYIEIKHKKIIEEKDNQIKNIKEMKYDEAIKVGSIYLLTTDKPNIIKCGRTKNSINKRVSSLQTGAVDDITILYEYKTSDDVLLESIVHNILGRYRLNSNREHFSCNVEYMKDIIDIIGGTLDILKSTYEYISKDEIIEKINQNISLRIESIPTIINKKNLYSIQKNNEIKIDEYICNDCGKIFNKRSDLAKHSREERGLF